jgi:hypothetical protein
MSYFSFEFFPTRIRYTSMSLPYHIGNGWLGGLMPTISFALVTQTVIFIMVCRSKLFLRQLL